MPRSFTKKGSEAPTVCYELSMASVSASVAKLKDGREVILRSAVLGDAEDIRSLARAAIGEEIYQLTSPEEFQISIEEEEEWIKSHLDHPSHLILVAYSGAQLLGMLDFTNGHRLRIAHTGEFGMSVDKNYRDNGVGRVLLKALIEWARAHEQIEKIGLCVHATNERAIALYRKMGFENEGLRKRELKYGPGRYVDTVVMGLWVK